MDEKDPGGGNDQQPPSHNIIQTLTAVRPPDANALSPSFP